MSLLNHLFLVVLFCFALPSYINKRDWGHVVGTLGFVGVIACDEYLTEKKRAK